MGTNMEKEYPITTWHFVALVFWLIVFVAAIGMGGWSIADENWRAFAMSYVSILASTSAFRNLAKFILTRDTLEKERLEWKSQRF